MNKLAKMSGISTRTLRYYDEIGLLKPERVASSGYCIYEEEQVNTLQQILFFKELGLSLKEIKTLLLAPDFDRERAFEKHLSALHKKRDQLDTLILNVIKSLTALKGETTMTDHEKFDGFKQRLIDENMKQFGKEALRKYGIKAIEGANAKVRGLTQEQYAEGERLRLEMEETLKAACKTGSPAGALAQKVCALHKKWLCLYYPKYNKEYHVWLGEMYVGDERIRANYDKLVPGCTEFFRDAINIYCKK